MTSLPVTREMLSAPMLHDRASMTSEPSIPESSDVDLTLLIMHAAPVMMMPFTSIPSDVSLSDNDSADALLPMPFHNDAHMEHDHISTDLPLNDSSSSG